MNADVILFFLITSAILLVFSLSQTVVEFIEQQREKNRRMKFIQETRSRLQLPNSY